MTYLQEWRFLFLGERNDIFLPASQKYNGMGLKWKSAVCEDEQTLLHGAFLERRTLKKE